MKKRFISIALIIFMLPSLFCLSVSADFSKSAASDLFKTLTMENLTTPSYATIEASSGKVVIAHNEYEHHNVGNMVKLMTLLLTFECVDNDGFSVSTTFNVSSNAQKISTGWSRAYLDAGKHESISIDQAVKAVCINGSYDCAYALAEFVGGNESNFVSMMNRKCTELGLENTLFTDSTGIDTGAYSCAHDMAVIIYKLVTDHPSSLSYLNLTYLMFEHTTTGEPSTELVSSNPFNRKKFFTESDGSMTGSSKTDGYSMAATYMTNDKRVFGVVVASPDENTRAAELRKILEVTAKDYSVKQLCLAGTFVRKVDIKDGVETRIKTQTATECSALIATDSAGDIKTTIELDAKLKAPCSEGTHVGYVVYLLDGEEIGRAELVTSENMKKANWLVRLFRKILSWFGL